MKWSLVDGNVVEFRNPLVPILLPLLPPAFSLRHVISGCRLHRGRQNGSSSFLPKLHLYKSLRRGPAGGRRDRTWLIGNPRPPPSPSHFAPFRPSRSETGTPVGGERWCFWFRKDEILKFLRWTGWGNRSWCVKLEISEETRKGERGKAEMLIGFGLEEGIVKRSLLLDEIVQF